MQGHIGVARHSLSEADLRQEPQPTACRRDAGPMFLGYAVGRREKLTGLDSPIYDLREVEPTDLGVERRLVIVIVRQ